MAAWGDPNGAGMDNISTEPKGNTDTWGIGLLELLWKVVEAIIDTCLRASVHIHNTIHRLRAGRGIGTSTLEIKLEQDLAGVEQDPLLLVFLDLLKAYDTVDRVHLMMNLEGYGAGPHMCKLLSVFWDQQEVITCQNGYHGPHFNTDRTSKQLGGLIRDY